MENAHEPDEQLAERYFLGELSDAEAEEYEAHYFECERCAEYVVEELHMMESGRAVAMMEQRSPAALAPVANIADERKKRRPNWIPAAAAAVFAAIGVGAPLMMRAPAPLMATVAEAEIQELRLSMDRDEAPAATILKAGVMNVLALTVPPVDARNVELSVRNAKTKKLITGPRRLSDEELKSPFQLLLGPLPAGSYEVVIESVREDGNRSTIASEAIEVRR